MAALPKEVQYSTILIDADAYSHQKCMHALLSSLARRPAGGGVELFF
jgi:hypothetical protein